MKKSPFLIKNSFLKNSVGFVIKDNYPVNKGHSLVIPIKKVRSIFDLKKNEYLKLFELVMKTKNYLKKNILQKVSILELMTEKLRAKQLNMHIFMLFQDTEEIIKTPEVELEL